MGASCSIEHHPASHAHSYTRVKIALFIAIGLILVQGTGAWISGSLALWADTIHVSSDAMALGISLFAGWLARRPESARRSYGYYRIEVVAALLNAGLLIAMAVLVLSRAYQRLLDPHDLNAMAMLSVATLGLIINMIMLGVLHSSRHDNLNIHGAYLHILGDSLSSVVVIASAFAIWMTNILWLDTAASVFVSMMIVWMAINLFKDSIHVVLEGTPDHLNADRIQQDLKSRFPQIVEIHDFHVWEITRKFFTMTAHLDVDLKDLSEIRVLLGQIHDFVGDQYGIRHATLQFEPVDKASGHASA